MGDLGDSKRLWNFEPWWLKLTEKGNSGEKYVDWDEEEIWVWNPSRIKAPKGHLG